MAPYYDADVAQLLGPDYDDAVVRASGGSLEAFNQLVETLQGKVFSVCYRVLGNRDDAADATQDAFLSAYRAMGTFHGSPTGFQPWLLRIATNACYDQLRRQRRRKTESLDATSEAPGDGSSRGLSIADPSRGPLERAEAAETGEAIQRALGQIPADQRMAVVLCDVQGLNYDEAATILGVELGTVKSRVSRARALLRTYLAANGELPATMKRLNP